jgi:hypothetical protein
VAAILISLGLIGLLVGAYAFTKKESGCVELIGADKSGSQDGATVVDRWSDEVDAIVQRAAACEGIVIAEAVYEQPGKGRVDRISLDVDAVNDLHKRELLQERLPTAKAAIQDVLEQPAGGRTNLIGWFYAAGAHLEDRPGAPMVNATLFTDGINSVEPVNMLEADLSPRGVTALIERLRPELPHCRGWQIRMLGIGTTAKGGVDPRRAQGAERFWRAFVTACGGTLVRYDTATQVA